MITVKMQCAYKISNYAGDIGEASAGFVKSDETSREADRMMKPTMMSTKTTSWKESAFRSYDCQAERTGISLETARIKDGKYLLFLFI